MQLGSPRRESLKGRPSWLTWARVGNDSPYVTYRNVSPRRDMQPRPRTAFYRLEWQVATGNWGVQQQQRLDVVTRPSM